MVLTDKEIRVLCNNEDLIVPFSEEPLQSESYDLSVGTTISIFKKEVKCLDLKMQDEIDGIYEEVELPLSGYTLSPKEYIIASLKEKISLPENITAHIRPRTRFTRLGLIVSDQHCNSTYSGNLKLGIFNATDYAIKIIPDLRIAQIVFEELKSTPSEEKLYKNKQNAMYQNEDTFIGAKLSDEIEGKVKNVIDILLKKEE